MRTTELFPLTEEALAKLLASQEASKAEPDLQERRKAPRWPFPGVVELWIPDEQGREEHIRAEILDLSLGGIGIRCDEWLTPGVELAIGFQVPTAFFHARAVVSYCTKCGGNYRIGLPFVFDDK